MQIFYINQNSELPSLRIELVNDGRYDFLKASVFNDAIRNAESITFSMWDENEKLKIGNAPCNVFSDYDGCEERIIIEYKWNKRDTKTKGKFKGQFKIVFGDGIKNENGAEYPTGDLIVPIYEDLCIFVK